MTCLPWYVSETAWWRTVSPSRMKNDADKQKRSLANASDLGAPEGTRTPDLLIRSQTLYPAELPAHILLAFSPENVFYYSAGGGESQAVFQKNSKKSANGHLYRKFAAKRAAFRLFVVAGSATEN